MLWYCPATSDFAHVGRLVVLIKSFAQLLTLSYLLTLIFLLFFKVQCQPFPIKLATTNKFFLPTLLAT